MTRSGAHVKEECTKIEEKELTIVRLETNVTKAKMCEDGNWLETFICKPSRNSSVDPKKHAFMKCCICPEGKQFFFPLLPLLSCFTKKVILKFSLSSFQVNIVIPSIICL